MLTSQFTPNRSVHMPYVSPQTALCESGEWNGAPTRNLGSHRRSSLRPSASPPLSRCAIGCGSASVSEPPTHRRVARGELRYGVGSVAIRPGRA